MNRFGMGGGGGGGVVAGCRAPQQCARASSLLLALPIALPSIPENAVLEQQLPLIDTVRGGDVVRTCAGAHRHLRQHYQLLLHDRRVRQQFEQKERVLFVEDEEDEQMDSLQNFLESIEEVDPC